MTSTNTRLAIIATILASAAAHAETRMQEVQLRNVNQEQRILDGLKSGALAIGEAARLEREQQQISQMQADALQHNAMSPAEKTRITNQQDRVSQLIRDAEANKWRGDPNTPGSRAMQGA